MHVLSHKVLLLLLVVCYALVRRPRWEGDGRALYLGAAHWSDLRVGTPICSHFFRGLVLVLGVGCSRCFNVGWWWGFQHND